MRIGTLQDFHIDRITNLRILKPLSCHEVLCVGVASSVRLRSARELWHMDFEMEHLWSLYYHYIAALC